MIYQYWKLFFEILQTYNRKLKVGFQSLAWSQSRSRKSASELVKIESRSRKWSHKLDGIGVGRIKTVPFSSDFAYNSDTYDPVKTGLSDSQPEAQEPTNHNASSQALRVQSDTENGKKHGFHGSH